ncbi:MAG: helix-turn-helix domain-containing protein [Lapillicoccus sp.]
MTLDELLAQYDISEADLSSSLERRLSAQPDPAAANLTPAEEDFWTRHAGVPLGDATGSPLARATDATMSVIGEASRSLTIEQVARLLDLHRSRVSHRLRDNQLYSFRIGSQRRLPRWQFTPEGTPLPGLETVLESLPADLHPAAVEGFFTTPDPDLDDASPAQWLASGGDPQRVVDEAEGLELW